jgi:hypothetical protein
VSDYQEVKQLHHEIKKLADEIERLRLTDEEREAISEACDEERWYASDYHRIRTLRALLDRTE